MISKPIDLKVNIISYGSFNGEYFIDYSGNNYRVDENNSFYIEDYEFQDIFLNFDFNYSLKRLIKEIENIKKDSNGNYYVNIQLDPLN
jgi:hypothetical protein